MKGAGRNVGSSKPTGLNVQRSFWGQFGDEPMVSVNKAFGTRNNIIRREFREPLKRVADELGVTVKDVVMPKELAKELSTRMVMSRSFDNWMRSTYMGGALEAWTRLWKRGVTRVVPAYYFTNILGDLQRSFVAGGSNVLNPLHAKSMFRILKNETPDKAVSIGGIRKSIGEWNDELVRNSITGTDSIAGRLGLDPEALPHSFGALRGEHNIFTRAEGTVGDFIESQRTGFGQIGKLSQNIEDVGRANMYLAMRRKGMSERDATVAVYDTLFDYNHGLTEFERMTLRRVIPFYSFLRFNTQFQATQLLKRPARLGVLDKASRASTAGTDPTWRDLLMPYEKDLTFVGTKDLEGENTPIGFRGTTKEAFNKLPTSFSLDEITRVSNEWFRNFHPGISASVSLITGRDPFTGGRQKPFLTSEKFRIFSEAPHFVQQAIRWEKFQTPSGEHTYKVDPYAFWAVQATGMARILFSTLGRLDEGGITTDTARNFWDGVGIGGTNDVLTPPKLDYIRSAIGAITGQVFIKFDEMQLLKREVNEMMRKEKALREALAGPKGASHLVVPPVSLR